MQIIVAVELHLKYTQIATDQCGLHNRIPGHGVEEKLWMLWLL